MKKAFQGLIALGIGVLPWLASAQNYIGSQTTGAAWGSVKEIIESIGKFINTSVMPVLVALAIIYFFWNLIHFIGNMDNEKEREAFKKYSVNAVLALFIMLSVWGIIAIGTNTLFGTQPLIPQFKTNPNGGTTPP